MCGAQAQAARRRRRRRAAWPDLRLVAVPQYGETSRRLWSTSMSCWWLIFSSRHSRTVPHRRIGMPDVWTRHLQTHRVGGVRAELAADWVTVTSDSAAGVAGAVTGAGSATARARMS